MGYMDVYFTRFVAAWLDAGWLAPGARLIDFGAQEFDGDPAATRAALRGFLRSRSADEEAAQALSVAAVYRALGVDYVSVDVDGTRGSAFFDLNTGAPPADWRGAFDFVNNEGTIEHLVNPINGFLVAHELLKIGGVARHNMPLSGCPEHGFMYPTDKFYAWLIGENRYVTLLAEAYVTSATPFVSPLFKNGPIAMPDVWMTLVYRKTNAAPFAFPADHLFVDDRRAIAARLAENMTALMRGRLVTHAAPEDRS
jgi:hypothetical protein